MRVYCDNKVAIVIPYNLVFHDRTKHVEVDKHSYIPTSEQIANVLTKGLPRGQFENLIVKLAMEDIFSPA